MSKVFSKIKRYHPMSLGQLREHMYFSRWHIYVDKLLMSSQVAFYNSDCFKAACQWK